MPNALWNEAMHQGTGNDYIMHVVKVRRCAEYLALNNMSLLNNPLCHDPNLCQCPMPNAHPRKSLSFSSIPYTHAQPVWNAPMGGTLYFYVAMRASNADRTCGPELDSYSIAIDGDVVAGRQGIVVASGTGDEVGMMLGNIQGGRDSIKIKN